MIEIDPETGSYDIVDYAAVDDCGKRINPQIVEGQVMGATAQALGAAMHEKFAYDEDGNLLTPNFYDYHVPHALDMPPLQHRLRRERRRRSRRSARRAWAKAAARASTRSAPRCRTRCAATAARSSTTAVTRTTACGRCSSDPASGRARRGDAR